MRDASVLGDGARGVGDARSLLTPPYRGGEGRPHAQGYLRTAPRREPAISQSDVTPGDGGRPQVAVIISISAIAQGRSGSASWSNCVGDYWVGRLARRPTSLRRKGKDGGCALFEARPFV